MKTTTNLVLVMLLSFGQQLFAQDITFDATVEDRIIFTHEARFFDSGGEDGRYSNYEDREVTICSENGAPMIVRFEQFNLESGKDFLYVFDGADMSALEVIGSPFTGLYKKPVEIQSSDRCLTFRMTSDFNVMRSGWVASIESILEPIPEPALAQE